MDYVLKLALNTYQEANIIIRSLCTTLSGLLCLAIFSAVILSAPAPLKAGSTNTYKVVSGDNLWLIANRFGTTIDRLKSANNLNSDLLHIGQTLVIPGGSTSHQPVSDGTNNTGSTYRVISGDSLWLIADKFGTTIDKLRSANNLNSDFLYVGQTLTIPGKSPASQPVMNGANNTGSTYKVVSGDNLWLIANRYGTTTDNLRSANNLSSDFLHVGQILIIPGGSPVPQLVSRGAVERSEPPVEPEASTAGAVEMLSWSQADSLFPRGTTAILQDYITGRQYRIYRLFGTNHADIEPYTAEDTRIMRETFGGKWSWERRPAILLLNNRAIACSIAGMPHGSSQHILNNNVNGHFCLHFMDSRTHGTNRIDTVHQTAVRRAAGL